MKAPQETISREKQVHKLPPFSQVISAQTDKQCRTVQFPQDLMPQVEGVKILKETFGKVES